MIEKDDVQMFNPHAPLDLFSFVFSCSPVFFPSSPVYLNAWNGLFGYDSVNQCEAVCQEKVRNVPNDLVLYFEWVHKTFPSNITRYVYRLASTKKRFYKTVEALAQLLLFTAALIKLMNFLISANKKNSHMRLTPVTNTYPNLFTFVFLFLGSFANKSVYL